MLRADWTLSNARPSAATKDDDDNEKSQYIVLFIVSLFIFGHVRRRFGVATTSEFSIDTWYVLPIICYVLDASVHANCGNGSGDDDDAIIKHNIWCVLEHLYRFLYST